MKKILLICLCLLSYLSLFAQRTINGKVTDSSGETLIGATVIQKGTSNGVITNIDGIFTISLLPNVPEIIQVSMIGYKKAELNLQKQGTSLLNVVLTEDNVNLDEVVVVGYGTQKKASITGAISNVGNKELTSVPVSSVTNALTGRIPGLVTRQESGRPGGDEAKMFIRGNASFNETEPLVLVDGVERSFTQINQDDIESISILKDASATAVYGVRGANGVILVTTRRGQERSKAQINFSAELGITEFNRIPEVLDAATVGRFQREGTMNDDLDPSKVANTKRIGVSEYDIYLYKTQVGLNVQAIGENPGAADAAGIEVTKWRYINILLSGAICGIGGAYCSMIINSGVWLRDSVAGLGWISVALVIFASWKPVNVIYGSFIFGALRVLKYYVPKNTYAIPTAFFDALPFLITALVLVISSMRKNKGGHIPAHLGMNYFREER